MKTKKPSETLFLVMLKAFYPKMSTCLVSDENACLTSLAELKWKEGFACKSCGHEAARRDITTEELSCLLTLRLQTCRAFRGKILRVMKEPKATRAGGGWEYLLLK